MDFPFGETVLFLAYLGSAADSHGNVVDGWSAEVDGVAVPGCAFDPGTSVEPAAGNRDSVVSAPRLFCPSGAPITVRGRVIVRGELYEVNGNPGVYVNPWTGWNPGVVVNLEQVTG